MVVSASRVESWVEIGVEKVGKAYESMEKDGTMSVCMENMGIYC